MLRFVLFALMLGPLGCMTLPNPLASKQNLPVGSGDLGSGDLGSQGDGGVNCICCGPSGDMGYDSSDLGPGTSDLGPADLGATSDLGPSDLGPGDLGPGTSDLGPHCASDLGPATSDLGAATSDLGPGYPGTGVTRRR